MLVTNTPRFEIIGHRGNPGNPLNLINIENTVESFEDAWKLGADGSINNQVKAALEVRDKYSVKTI